MPVRKVKERDNASKMEVIVLFNVLRSDIPSLLSCSLVRSRLVGPGIPGGFPKKSSVLVTRGNILKMIGRKGMLKVDIPDNVQW